ncbi:MAG: acyl-CoA dehydrogenase family protein, partial [Clostridia bacterium]|nr:acyl-CoA dehydrogenase family protein [Clostridia bacterium]
GLAELGLMGILVPEEYGGLGASTMSYVVAMEEVAKADLGVGLSWGGHVTLGCLPFVLFADERQKRKYLPPLARGERIGAMGLTEPGAGSDAAGIRTTAVLAGDHWVINGRKAFISSAGTDISYGLVILCVTGQTPQGRPEYSNIIVERGTPGYTVGPKYRKMGWHLGDTRDQIFEDCRVPAENLLGQRGAGLRQFLAVLDVGRIGFAASSLGLAQACLEASLDYAKQRKQFGQFISRFQAIQFKLAEMAVAVDAARLLTYQAAYNRDTGKPFRKEAAMAKYLASKTAVDASREAVQIHGGYGFLEEYPVCRYYRNAKVLEIGEGSNEIVRLVVARELGC